MNTQLKIESYTRAVPQGSWRWQKRGASSLVVWPAIMPMPHLNSHVIREFARREGAIGALSGRNVIEPHTRADAEALAKRLRTELVPGIGGEFGPWLTVTKC